MPACLPPPSSNVALPALPRPDVAAIVKVKSLSLGGTGSSSAKHDARDNDSGSDSDPPDDEPPLTMVDEDECVLLWHRASTLACQQCCSSRALPLALTLAYLSVIHMRQ
jgi:hypothetical protein